MDRLEHAYLLQDDELFLLLSLLDERPVMMFSAGTPDRPRSHWERTAVALQSAGLLSSGPAGMEISPEQGRLLAGMKQAKQIWTILQPGQAGSLRTLYGGRPGVLLETGCKGGRRLSALPVPVTDWCREEEILPELLAEQEPPEPAPPAVWLPFSAPETAWLTRTEAVAVVTEYTPQGTRSHRWVWPGGFRTGTVVHQTVAGTCAERDTEEERRNIFAISQEENPT